MSSDRLTHAGGSQNLREVNERSQSPDSSAGETNFNIRSSPPPLEWENGNQQLRSGPDESNTYRSEEHRHVYQNQSYSFNDQRDNYAEHALNENLSQYPVQNQNSYDYQAQGPQDGNRAEVYQRYIDKSGNKPDIRAEESIFLSSDINLADATENYLERNSKRYSEKLDAIDRKMGRTEGRINRLESKSLQYRISYKPWKHRLIIDSQKGLKHKEIETSHKRGMLHDRIHKTETTRIVGRLKFRSEKIAFTEKHHSRDVRKNQRKSDRRGFFYRQIKGDFKNTLSGSEFQEDELMAELDQKKRMAAFGLRRIAKSNSRKLKHTFDGYERLKFQNTRLASLKAQREILQYRSGIDLQKRKANEAARQGLLREKQKRRVKKQMIQNYKREQGNFITRTRNQHHLKKTVKKEKKIARKRVKTIIGSALMLLFLLLFLVIIVFILSAVFLDMGGETVVNTVSQNDYYDMTDVTKYFRNKEAELEEFLNPDSSMNPENLESVILEEEPDIFEFIYDLDEISFDANTLVAYLSAKYNEFDLDLVMEELDEIFELYYTLEWEVREEYRDEAGGIVKICYITLTKADFYELLKERIEDAAGQEQMEGFYLAGNGQQVYGPVMNVDWRNKISSNYGYRVHPITGVKTFHDGVDIAIPTGTALYSAVEGTVVDSHYSDSAGNMIIIQNDSGWRITFMHMDSRAVSVGDTIKQGQYVGTSGNTGNSTGPHLHIRVHDAEDQPINPVFIIPFSTLEASESL